MADLGLIMLCAYVGGSVGIHLTSWMGYGNGVDKGFQLEQRQALVMVPRWEWEMVVVKDPRTGGGARLSWTVGLPVFKSCDPRMDKK